MGVTDGKYSTTFFMILNKTQEPASFALRTGGVANDARGAVAVATVHGAIQDSCPAAVAATQPGGRRGAPKSTALGAADGATNYFAAVDSRGTVTACRGRICSGRGK